jgi:CBS-domain-containing membrane protein
MTIRDVMTRDVVTARPDRPVHLAARLMVDHGIRGLPVVDEHGRIVGVVIEGNHIVRQKPREEAPWWRLFFEDPETMARAIPGVKAVETHLAVRSSVPYHYGI